MNREEAIILLQEKVQSQNLRKHCLATEAIMRELARRLGEDPDKWGLAGLLHDLDFEETKEAPNLHGLRTVEMLRQRGLDEETLAAIKGHNAENLGGQRGTRFEHALAAAETITGLIVATALVYPDKKLASVKPESITSRMKKKDFARNVDRNIIGECEKLGLGVPDFAALSLTAMQGIASDLGL